MGLMDWLFGKKDEKPLGPIVQNNKPTFFKATTKSGSNYDLELDNDGKWWVHKNGRQAVTGFTGQQAETFNATNFQQIVGKSIVYINEGGIIKTSTVVSIQRNEQAA